MWGKKRETDAAAAGGGKISRVTVWRPSWNYFLLRFFFIKFWKHLGEMRKAEAVHWPRQSIFLQTCFKQFLLTFFRFQTEKMFTLSFTRPAPSLNSPPSYNRRQCFTHLWHQDFSPSAREVRVCENPWMCSYHTLNFKGWNIKTEKNDFQSVVLFLRQRCSWIYLLKFYFSYNFHPFEPVVPIFPPLKSKHQRRLWCLETMKRSVEIQPQVTAA